VLVRAPPLPPATWGASGASETYDATKDAAGRAYDASKDAAGTAQVSCVSAKCPVILFCLVFY
jgi:hypothetical protein